MAKNIETIESLLSTIPIEGPRLIITKDTTIHLIRQEFY